MKIDINNTHDYVEFKDLNNGDAFFSENDFNYNNLFIKINELFRPSSKIRINAINLNSGSNSCFSDDEIVFPAKVKVVVDNENSSTEKI